MPFEARPPLSADRGVDAKAVRGHVASVRLAIGQEDAVRKSMGMWCGEWTCNVVTREGVGCSGFVCRAGRSRLAFAGEGR